MALIPKMAAVFKMAANLIGEQREIIQLLIKNILE